MHRNLRSSVARDSDLRFKIKSKRYNNVSPRALVCAGREVAIDLVSTTSTALDWLNNKWERARRMLPLAMT